MTDLVFLRALRDKLKGGNIRSIHLNALPGRYATRLDVANLNNISNLFAEKFIDQILSQASFEFKISFDGIDLNAIQQEEQKKLGLLSKRLNSLNIENEDNYKEHGIKTFGFGFPILIKTSKQDPKKIIKAPIFIWPLELIKSTNKVNTWSILRNKRKNENGKIVDEEIHSVGINEVLISYLKTDENIQIPQINEDLLEDAVVDKNELVEECFKILKAINSGTSSDTQRILWEKLNEPLQNIPEASYFESIAGNLPWIHFGGVFGLYRTQKESIITDIDRIIAGYNEFEFEKLKVENFNGTAFSAVETDPSQQEILTTLGIEPKKIIQGPPGTGKSQSLTALITNALANNLKCLVVCEKKTALDVIKKNLHHENDQIGALAAVIEDINQDRDGIVNSVRDRLGNISSYNSFNPSNYLNILKVVENSANEINLQHSELDKAVYLGDNWTNSVGEYLKRQRISDFSSLKSKLDYKLFKFQNDPNELPSLLNKIKTGEHLFREINKFDHPLDILNDEIFKDGIPRAVQIKLEEVEKDTSEKIGLLKQKILTDISEYKNWLKNHYSQRDIELNFLKNKLEDEISQYKEWLDKHYEEYYYALKLKIKEYLIFINSNYEKYQELLYKNDKLTQFRINVGAILSKKYKTLKEVRVKIIESVSSVKKAHFQKNYFDHVYFNSNKIENLKIYVDDVSALEKSADVWYERNVNEKQELVKRLASSEIHPEYKFKEKELSGTENIYFTLVDYLSKDWKITAPIIKARSHADKVNEIKTLLSQVKEMDSLVRNYVDILSSEKSHFYYDKKSQILDGENNFKDIVNTLTSNKILKRSIAIPNGHIDKLPEIDSIKREMDAISNNLNEFIDYYNWRKYFIELSPIEQMVIKALIDSDSKDWNAQFESWYYFWIIAIAESSLKDLPKSDNKLVEFSYSKRILKENQIKSIISNWSKKQYETVREVQYEGINPVSLFNKRGSRGERRNSLRKIINTSFKLFTDFFPVVMLSPSVCSSIIPLIEGLFDLVVFDEASQLRLEDTFPALLRGKIKVVSGDSQQMPPSNFFQGGSAILNPTDEETDEEVEAERPSNNQRINSSLDLADSESLLVYAENCNYKPSYLKVHYRSQHPDLINFSNYAFYGKRLIPMPAKIQYTPIQYIQVNGVYEEQVNRDEARQVVDILLHHISPLKNGKYPSVGVATFNLYQRNLILEEISRARQINPEYDLKISNLGSELFVKNLENIQGDERDIIIISTTFGRRYDGTFRQNFGPIVQSKGYKLLNVIITRAKLKIFICSSIPQEIINQYPSLLQQNKNTGRGIFYSYLAYAKAISDQNLEVKEGILKQVYENCEFKSFDVESVYGSESPFEDEVYYRIAERIGQKRLQQQYRIGGFRIDLVIKSKISGHPIIAIECDGAKYHSSNEAYAWDMFRQQRLEEQGFIFYRIWSTNWWNNTEKEIQKLVSFIIQKDNEEQIVNTDPLEEVLVTRIINPVSSKPEEKKRVNFDSIVKVKSPEGKVLNVKFTKAPSNQNTRPDENGVITIYEKAPLALSLLNRTEGETCQLGLLEVYYEILEIH